MQTVTQCISLKSGKGKELLWIEVTDGTILLKQENLEGEDFINPYNKQEEITHQLEVAKKPS